MDARPKYADAPSSGAAHLPSAQPEAPSHEWGAPWPRTYPASIIAVTDADSFSVFLDRGGDDYWRTNLRLNGGNAREHDDPGGQAAIAYVRRLVGTFLAVSVTDLFAFPVQVISLKWDKFGGRIDGSLIIPGVGDVMQTMIRNGYAAPWNGRGPKPVPPWPIPGDAQTSR